MNCLSTFVAFSVLYNFAFGSDGDYSHENPLLNDKRYQFEVNAGSKTDLLENKHYYHPKYYSDLSRRFVPVYPYKEIQKKPKELDENDVLASLKGLVQAAQSRVASNEEAKLIPVKAPPELVLAIAKSAKQKYPKPSDPAEEVIKNDVLRTGDYWNAVWKEEVDPSKQLRTGISKTPTLGSVKAKVMPGSKLYDLVLALQKMSPRLLYIINDNRAGPSV